MLRGKGGRFWLNQLTGFLLPWIEDAVPRDVVQLDLEGLMRVQTRKESSSGWPTSAKPMSEGHMI